MRKTKNKINVLDSVYGLNLVKVKKDNKKDTKEEKSSK